MNYPLITEYIEAIKAAEDNFEELKHLRPVLDDDGEPVMTSGNFAVVFKMKDEQTGKLHAVKCFLKEQEGRAEAYRLIAEELEYVSSTFITPIKYLDKELFVDTKASDETEFPVLLMDWVEGQTLDKYIREHIDDEYELQLLAYQFSRLAMWLMPQPFAHGDLKPDNILVRGDGSLVLVDYDGMYVPAMKGQKARELGSPDFRHPSRTEEDFDEHIDDFSLASILLSLKAISLEPELLEQYGTGDRLLFSEKDYCNLAESKVMNAIKALMQDTELSTLLSMFILASSQKNLSLVSFRIFHLGKPKEFVCEKLGTEVTDKDLENAWKDEYGVKYSADKSRLLSVPNNIKNYSINIGTTIICDSAFSSCPFLESISIPETVVIIGNHCFNSCESLNTITIPNTVKSIGEYAFYYCLSLKSIKLSNNITKISKSTFEYCSSLQSITIPNSVRTIEDEAFSCCESLVTIDIPDSVSIIGGDVFSYCSSLESFTIPNKIESIEYDTFCDCASLKHIKLSDKLTRIDTQAFCGCKSLSSIIIPKNVNFIGERAFVNCVSLRSIVVSNDNITFDSRNNCNAIIKTKENLLLVGCRCTVIPNDVEIIGECAFSGSFLKSIILPNSIKKISDDAFWGNDFLTDIFVQSGERNKFVQLLPEYENIIVEIQDFEILNTIASKEDLSNAWTDEYGVMYSKDGKRLLKFPKWGIDHYAIKEDTSIICDNAFSQSDIEYINFPNSIKSIGKGAFSECYSLNVEIPESLSYLGDHSFAFTNMKKINIPNSVTHIGNNAFCHCERLKHVIIPQSVIHIGINPFIGCVKLKAIDCLSNNYIYKDGGFYSGDMRTLISCISNKDSFSIPGSVIHIADSAFYECRYLKMINIPNSVVSIGKKAFAECHSLEKIEISNSVQKIGTESFFRCNSLKDINIPPSVLFIGNYTFDRCRHLRQIQINSESIQLSDNVFYGCDSLERIVIPVGTRNTIALQIPPNYINKLVEQ